MNSSIIPVVIFHEGCPKHLAYSVRSAERHNKRVILLGNGENKHVAREWQDSAELDTARYEAFKKVFVNYSTYSDFFALICFKRYFLYYELMEKLGFDRIIAAESDLYNCADYSSIPSLSQAYAMVSTVAEQDKDYGWSSCCHCSYWTKEALKDFLDFCYDTYGNNRALLEEKWEYHQKNRQAGGVCDMTLAYLWSRDKQNVLNSAKIIDGGTIDQNLCDPANFLPGEYKYSSLFKIKKYIFKRDKAGNKQPYLEMRGGALVKVYAIHCSGRGKSAIKAFDKSYFAVCLSQAGALMKMRLGALKNKLKKQRS